MAKKKVKGKKRAGAKRLSIKKEPLRTSKTKRGPKAPSRTRTRVRVRERPWTKEV